MSLKLKLGRTKQSLADYIDPFLNRVTVGCNAIIKLNIH